MSEGCRGRQRKIDGYRGMQGETERDRWILRDAGEIEGDRWMPEGCRGRQREIAGY